MKFNEQTNKFLPNIIILILKRNFPRCHLFACCCDVPRGECALIFDQFSVKSSMVSIPWILLILLIIIIIRKLDTSWAERCFIGFNKVAKDVKGTKLKQIKCKLIL